MQTQLKTVLAIVAIAAGAILSAQYVYSAHEQRPLGVAAPCCQAARLLRGNANRFDQEDDPSGYSAQVAARVMTPLSTKTKAALTPENAEATANPAFIGVYRAAAVGGGQLSYATVESDPSVNFGRRKEVVKPRARSAIDIRGQPNLSSGAPQIPVVVMNGAAVAQTYEGATAAAMPEALFVNQGKKKTVVANSMLTATTGALPKASRAGSFGATAQPVGSMALSGAANGKIVLAQADTAVALAQAEKVDRMAPISRTAWQN